MENQQEPLDTMDAGELIAQRLGTEDDNLEDSSDGVAAETEEVEATAETEEVDVEVEEQEEATALESLAQLAEALEIDFDSLANLKHQFRANGEDTEATLSELVAGYQKDANYRQKTAELSEQRKQWDAERQQYAQQYNQQAMQLGHYLQNVEQVLVGELNSTEMEALRASDPNQWMLRRQEYQDRIAQVQHQKQAAAIEWDQHQQQIQHAQTQQFQEMVTREQEALLNAIPDWGDDVKNAINSFATQTYGFSTEELGQVYDHRQVRMAQDAMKYHKLMAETDNAEQKVLDAPVIQKSGKAKKPMSVETKKMLETRKRFQRDGSVDDAAALLQQRLSR